MVIATHREFFTGVFIICRRLSWCSFEKGETNYFRLAPSFQRVSPSKREVTQGSRVPGSDFADLNAFGICQALSWLAKERRDLQDQIERERQIEPLIKRLIALN